MWGRHRPDRLEKTGNGERRENDQNKDPLWESERTDIDVPTIYTQIAGL